MLPSLPPCFYAAISTYPSESKMLMHMESTKKFQTHLRKHWMTNTTKKKLLLICGKESWNIFEDFRVSEENVLQLAGSSETLQSSTPIFFCFAVMTIIRCKIEIASNSVSAGAMYLYTFHTSILSIHAPINLLILHLNKENASVHA